MNIDGEMHFGELEEASPRSQMRPDANRHYAVARCGGPPAAGELPVFIDLDVLLELESHAASDTRVELGGVVLGAQCVDADGQPFVLVTDSLRAEHYQATKGSFKFTHETWESITRRREEFPAETELVGWYHTHPDWGVFLSGMDMFICNHFFARPLDVAIVIDPCRGDRGVFVWDRGKPGEIRRAAGYYLTTSRLRQQELVNCVRLFEEGGVMRAFSGASVPAPASSAPIIQVAEPRPWLVAAVCGMLTLQLLAILLIGWRVLQPSGGQARSTEVAQLTEWLEQQSKQSSGELANTARLEVLDRLLADSANLPANAASQLSAQAEELAQLRAALQGLDAAQRDARQQLAAREQELKRFRTTAAARERQLQRKLDQSLASLAKTRQRNEALQSKLGTGDDALLDEDDDAAAGAVQLARRHPLLIGVGALSIVVVGALVSVMMLRRRAADDFQEPRRD